VGDAFLSLNLLVGRSQLAWCRCAKPIPEETAVLSFLQIKTSRFDKYETYAFGEP
jgi:hypothetical protein